MHLSLISHTLKSCNAEVFVPPGDSKGGALEFDIAVTTPDNGTELLVGKHQTFEIKLGCIAKTKETDAIAFKICSTMQGICQIIGSEEPLKSDITLWEPPARALFTLLSHYVSETVARMGYKNVFIPLSIPGRLLPIAATKPKKRSK